MPPATRMQQACCTRFTFAGRNTGPGPGSRYDPHKHSSQLNWGVLGSARSAAVLTAPAKSEVKCSAEVSGFSDLAAGRHVDPVHSTPAPFERNQTNPNETKSWKGQKKLRNFYCCFTFIDSLSSRFLANRARTCALDTKGRCDVAFDLCCRR